MSWYNDAAGASPVIKLQAADRASPGDAALANEAAWLTAKRGEITIAPAPYTPPRCNEIVVRVRAVAINPIDWMTQSIGDLILPWLSYPFIPGTDVAGEIVAVGDGVSRFRIGERVLGHAAALEKSRNNPAEGAFQRYVVLLEDMASPIPDAMAYENAAVLPLGLSTAACGLFPADYLALQPPSAKPEPTGKTLLIWGGSTSVGSNAIQLAVAAGYEVVATASPTNFDYVRALGAGRVFDYRSSTVITDLIQALDGRVIAGALAVGVGSTKACLDVVHACEGAKFVAVATPPVSFAGAPTGFRRNAWLAPILVRMLALNAATAAKARLRGIGTKFIWGGALVHTELSRLIYAEFLPRALADRRYVAAPEPLVVGHGLDAIPAALQAQRNGVSARKIVVTL